MRYSQYYPGSRPTIHLRPGPRNSNYLDITRLDFWKCSHRFLHCLVKYLEGIKYWAVWDFFTWTQEQKPQFHPRDTGTFTSASQLPCHSKPSSSFPASSSLFSVFSTSTKEQTVSWVRAALNHTNLNTCQSYFHMKCQISHSCFHRLLWKAVVLSRTNIRSNQKNILK